MKRRKRLLIILGIVVCIILSVVGIYFLEVPIKNGIKHITMKRVMNNEKYLNEVVKKIETSDLEFRIVEKKVELDDSITYRDLDCDVVEKMFKEFSLICIEDRMDNPEGRYVRFQPSNNIGWIWPDYFYGFYYSEEDEAINILERNKCNAEYEYTGDFTYLHQYKYTTEKITENWWYYEMTLLSKYK